MPTGEPPREPSWTLGLSHFDSKLYGLNPRLESEPSTYLKK